MSSDDIPCGKAVAAAVFHECANLGLNPREVYPGIIVTKGDFANKVLGIDPSKFIPFLDARVPVVGAGDSITPGALQWVTGQNVNLHFRGNELPRRKIWLQDGSTDKSVLVYSYTGWQNPIAFATSDWNQDDEFAKINGRYNAFAKKCGFDAANHDIITAYDDNDANIGYHYDKMRSLAATGGIAVVKMGAPRRFCVRERLMPQTEMSEKQMQELQKKQNKVQPFFNEVVESGALIFMTTEANYLTQHAVPEMETAVGLSGSIVFRTVKSRRSVRELQKNVTELSAKRKAKHKEKRKEKSRGSVREVEESATKLSAKRKAPLAMEKKASIRKTALRKELEKELRWITKKR